MSDQDAVTTHLVGILADGCSFAVEDSPEIRSSLREKGATILHAGLEEWAAQTLAATIGEREELDDDGYLSRRVERLIVERCPHIWVSVVTGGFLDSMPEEYTTVCKWCGAER